MNSKKYTLKPGRHQFAPGSHAIHSNDNLSDEEAAWYLERYPHITVLFTINPENEKLTGIKQTTAESEACRVSEAGMLNKPQQTDKIKSESVESTPE